MRTFAKKLAAVGGLALALTAVLAGPASADEPEEGCIGLPESGGALYYCLRLDPDATVPSVQIFGNTPVSATVPAICYFIDCTEPTTVSENVPVDPEYTEPAFSSDIFDLRTNCSRTYGCFDDPFNSYTYYRIRYDAFTDTCQFQTNDPRLNAISYPRVACAL